MNQKGKTPDEKFIIKLYELALLKKDPHAPVSWKKVADAVGLKESGVKNIIKLLAQANFIKKIDDILISLTPHGVNFVKDNL